VPLDDALAIVVLLRGDQPRFDRAVVRWHARFCLEAPQVGLGEAQLALSALRSLSGPDAAAGAAALVAMSERHGLGGAAQVLHRLAHP
jgi:hypothetical protein